jgi:hypothetical protein
MRGFPLYIGLSVALVALSGGVVEAQDHDKPDEPAVQLWPTADVTDLWHKWRSKDEPAEQDAADTPRDPQRRFRVIAPGIGARPSTGLTLGLNGNLAFYQGDPASTHLTTMIGGFRVTQKNQVLSNVRFAVFTAEDHWLLQGDNRVNWTSLDTYELGSESSTDGAANLKFRAIRLTETAYRPIGRLFVGGGLDLSVRANIRAGEGETGLDRSVYTSYTRRHGFDIDAQKSTGTNVAVLLDTRDNAINAGHGWLASAAYHTFFKGLGGDSTWQELAIDVRTFRPLTRTGSHLIAFWFMSDLVTGGVAPYLDLPAIGGDIRSARGYAEGRYRGEHLVYGEAEYRGSLTPNGLVGFVAFLNTSTIGSSETGTRLFDAYAPGAGFGFRVLLNKRSRTNLAADWGWGKDGSRGFYLALQEAF